MIDQRSFLLIAASITVFLMTSACRSRSLSPEGASSGSSSTQTIALLGQNLSRGARGKEISAGGFTPDALEQRTSQGQSQGKKILASGFTSEPPGDWIATKVFVADSEGEFFLNLNSKGGSGEISIKDPEYGNVVLRELSRVF